MPCNKNSERKKKIVDEELQSDIHVIKKKPGRPKKEIGLDSRNETKTPEVQSEVHDVLVSRASHSSKRKCLQVFDLKMRTSETSIFYDTHVGLSLEKFQSSSKLATNRVILQRYCWLIASVTNPTRNGVITTTTQEIRHLWVLACIPMQNYRGCWDIVQKCITNWVDAKKHVRKNAMFQNELNNLLDLRPVTCSTLSALKEHLKKSGNPEWKTDYEFFKGQLKHPQST